MDGAPIEGRPLRIGVEGGLPLSFALIGASTTAAPVFDPANGITLHPAAPFFALSLFQLDEVGRSGAIVDVPTLTPAFVGAAFFV